MIDTITIRNITLDEKVLLTKDGSSPFVLDTDGLDFGSVPAMHTSYSYRNLVGAAISATALQPRTISIIGNVWDDTESDTEQKRLSVIEKNKKTLSRVFNPVDFLEIRIGSFLINGKVDSSVRFSPYYSENNDIKCKFSVTVYCNNPMFRMNAPSTIPLSGVQGKFKFPLIIPKNEGVIFGIKTSYSLVPVKNSGDVDTGAVFTLRASGTVINPVLTDVYTNKSIKINKTMEKGEEIVICTEVGNQSISGEIDGKKSNYYRYWDYSNSWMTFPVGTSLIGFSAEDESYLSLNVSIQLNPQFYSMGGE